MLRQLCSLKILMATTLIAATALDATATIVIDTVPVGDPGNAADSRYGGYGAVSYTYQMGKYDVTTGQYTAFLNAVAATDTYGLYNTNMADPATHSVWGCNIQRMGTPGNYTYTVGTGSPADIANWANRPVNWVSWGDAARFANWLHNGQPTGTQGLSTTEDGAYFMDGAVDNLALLLVTRKPDATWVIPSEDEWYKAAYYDPSRPGGAGYWDYTTRSDTAPGRDLDDVSGNNANFVPYKGGPFPIDAPYYTTIVGEFQNSEGPYGTFDQGGNVNQWNEANISGLWRGVRGGSFSTNDYYLHASTRSLFGAPVNEYYGVGLRVANVPEPSSLSLLALSTLVACGRRESKKRSKRRAEE